MCPDEISTLAFYLTYCHLLLSSLTSSILDYRNPLKTQHKKSILLINCMYPVNSLFPQWLSLFSALSTKLPFCTTSSCVQDGATLLFSPLVPHLLNLQRRFYSLLWRPSFIAGNIANTVKKDGEELLQVPDKHIALHSIAKTMVRQAASWSS